MVESSNIRLYIQVCDAVNNSSEVVLRDVSVTEPITGKTVVCSNKNDLVASNNKVTKTIDFQVTPFVGFDENQTVTLVFNSNVQANTVANNIYLSKDNAIIYPEYDVIDNKIVIYAPQGYGYVDDTEYELHIGTDVKSQGGNGMLSEKVILIYILDEYYMFMNV